MAASLERPVQLQSDIDQQDELPLSALRGIVQALDGELDLVVRLPKGEFRVAQFKKQPA